MAKKKKKKENKEIYKTKETGKLPVSFNLLAFLIILLTGVLAYSNSFNCEFQFDDIYNIFDQSYVKNLGNFSHIGEWLKINNRPLPQFTFALNFYFNRASPAGYHAVNLLVHVFMGFFVFLFVKLILSLIGAKGETRDFNGEYFALFTALVTILHPIQTQGVTYIIQRMTSMSSMFYIISIYTYVKGRISHIDNGIDSGTIVYYSAAALSALAALLSKQIAVTLPLMYILVEFFFIRNRDGRIYKKYIYSSLSMFFLLFIIIALSGNLPRETGNISRGQYLVTQFRVIAKYLQLLILPINQNIDYNFSVSNSFWALKEMAGFALIAGLLTAGVLMFKKNKLISFGIFWFFLALTPESSIIPIRDVIFEHRLYLPMLGFSLCLITILYKVLSGREKLRYSVIILLILIYGIASFNRNRVWKTEFSLWADTLEKSPDNPRPYISLGKVYLKKKEYEKAIEYLEQAVKIKPDYVDALNNLGAVWYSKGNIDKALDYYNRAMKINPNDYNLLNNLGIIWYQKKDFDKAIYYYDRALKKSPLNEIYLNNLGTAYGAKGDKERAVEYFKKALDIRPDYPDALANLGLIYYMMGNLDKAEEYYKRALMIEPGHANALNLKRAVMNMKGP